MIKGAPIVEVAEVFDLSERQLRRMTDTGQLAAIIGPAGELRVRLPDVVKLVAQMSPNGLATVATIPKLYSVAEVAERFGCSAKSVRRLIDAGELEAYQLRRSGDGKRGSSIRVAESELRRFLERAAL